MKSANNLFRAALVAGAFLASAAQAASWQDTLSNAASQLSGQNDTQRDGDGAMSLSSLTGLLNGGNQSLASGSLNNAAGLLSWCVKQKVASLTDTENVKNQLLDKLGLSGEEQQTQDTGYLAGLQGILNGNNNQRLDLNTLGSSPLAEQVKTKACDLVLKQGMQFLS